jgi:hypothetical protein
MELEGNGALDLDELKGHDDKTFRCTRTATGDNGKLARHFRLAGQRFERLAPEIIRGTDTKAITLENGAEMAGKGTHNFVARLGASRSRGGTRPCDGQSVLVKTCHPKMMISPTAVKASKSMEAKASASHWGGCETETLDAPFLTNDSSEGAQEADGSLSTF